ncbi:MAG: sulfurtransferase [Pseudomonadales bacterium]
MDPASLQSALAGPTGADGAVVLFDCRTKLGAPDWGLQVYQQGHIAGAQHLDLDRHLAAPAGAQGRHPLPDRLQLAAHLRQQGVGQNSQVVVYDDAGGAFAARAWWCLRWLGHRAVAVLDGGLPAYAALPGVHLQTDVPVAPNAGDFEASAPLTRSVDADAVLRQVQQPTGDTALLDARALARFNGAEEPIDAVAGHIPGAQCRPFTDNLDSNGQFKQPEVLREELATLPPQVICYCGSGVTAAHNILALVHAGYAEPALYPGSWSGWITDPNRPLA